MICLKLATRTGSFQVEVDATPADCGVANINYERKPLAVPGTRNTGTNYADSRYQLPQIDIVRRIISTEGLTVRYVKKMRRYSSYRGEISEAPPNVVKRNFHADKPGLLWLTDISEFPADDGKIYF